MSENTEKRQRTKKKLADALIGLCEQKNYYDITIWDICNKAGLYRSTFYRYYDTKDDMLRDIEHDYVEHTRSLTATLRNYRNDASEDVKELYLEELTKDMEYHHENARLCRFLLSPGGDIYFRQKMLTSVEESARNSLYRHGCTKTRELDYMVIFFSAGFINTIYEWLSRGDRQPSQIAAFLLEMIELMHP